MINTFFKSMASKPNFGVGKGRRIPSTMSAFVAVTTFAALVWANRSSATDLVFEVCSEALPTHQWSNCVGKLIRAQTMFYHGEFQNGVPHGLGREANIENSTVYVGTFVAGKRICSGVEYSFLRKILRAGIWSDELQSSVDIDTSLFPYDGPDAKGFFSSFYRTITPGRASPKALTPDRLSEDLRERLRWSEQRIRELESINQALRDRLQNSDNTTADPVSRRVPECVRLGLKPGTTEFSRCIERQK